MAVFTAAKAAGTWTVSVSTNMTLVGGDTIKIGARTFRFTATTGAADDIFLASVGTAGTRQALASLVAIVNGTGTIAASGADGYTGSVKHQSVKASTVATTVGQQTVVFTALMPGAAGNEISFVDSSTAGAVDAAVLGTTTAGSGSAHADLTTWVLGLETSMQLNSQVGAECEKIIRELT